MKTGWIFSLTFLNNHKKMSTYFRQAHGFIWFLYFGSWCFTSCIVISLQPAPCNLQPGPQLLSLPKMRR
jgi:hypothetical protein